MSPTVTAVTAHSPQRLELPPFVQRLPVLLIAVGGLGALAGALLNPRQFGYSYLLAFMFFLSLCLGALFLTLIHHLFDASWSVPIRRVNEHLAFLLPVMAVLFIPIALLAPTIYDWMRADPLLDHAVRAKRPLFSQAGFYLVAVVVFGVWTWLSFSLRKWSILQDRTSDKEEALRVRCTRKMRMHSAYGIYAFAFTLTLGAIMWVKALEYQWFSTMYGVYYFAGSVWTALATVYVLTLVLQRTGPLESVVHNRQYHDIGVLLLAFTVFYAYIAFSQYFLIWNANIPEETFFFTKREQGSWWDVGLLLVFGHFALPFLALLRIDAKLALPLMLPLCGWAWAMHFCDMSYNIMPPLHPQGFLVHPLDLACLAFIGGVLSLVFIRYFKAHAPYPLKDPRLAEALGVLHTGARPPIASPE